MRKLWCARRRLVGPVVIAGLGLVIPGAVGQAGGGPTSCLQARVDATHGSYSLISADGVAGLHDAQIAVKVDGAWLQAANYPTPVIAQSIFQGELGSGHAWTVTYRGDGAQPTLVYRLRVYANRPFADVAVTLYNTTGQTLEVERFRPLKVAGERGIDLNASEATDRVLSDSFSEDRPRMQIRDFDDPVDGMHRGVGSQLIYNRDSGESLFLGALTSNKLLTVLRLHVTGVGEATRLTRYEVDDEGTTELTRQYSLKGAPQDELVALKLAVKPGARLSSERLLIGLSKDYHNQLETYGAVIRRLHNARPSPPPPMGWWSWTAYYAKLTQQDALADADWLAHNLKADGYTYFHIDEGYSVARGDYLTPRQATFPGGMAKVYAKVRALGLTPAIWTAPFEVSDKAWVFQHHQDWLLHDYAGKLIRLTGAGMPYGRQKVYVLDVTNPGAQTYLRKTYATMARQWGIKDIKLDFMEDSCVEGKYYRAGTTALQAQRIGLRIIRSAVGNGVLLDKDGSVMLNPVGLVDLGRISQDTSHSFAGTKDAATGIAARYYMDHNFFLTDPDAFMVTRGEGDHALTLDEARASIAIAAVAGGMFEIGDRLPVLAGEPERLSLLKNSDLLAMVKLGRPSIPLDLMSYRPQDKQPSIFLLKENAHERILTVFNWTDGTRTHTIDPSTIGLKMGSNYAVTNVWNGRDVTPCPDCDIELTLAPHSVAMLKIVE